MGKPPIQSVMKLAFLIFSILFHVSVSIQLEAMAYLGGKAILPRPIFGNTYRIPDSKSQCNIFKFTRAVSYPKTLKYVEIEIPSDQAFDNSSVVLCTSLDSSLRSLPTTAGYVYTVKPTTLIKFSNSTHHQYQIQAPYFDGAWLQAEPECTRSPGTTNSTIASNLLTMADIPVNSNTTLCLYQLGMYNALPPKATVTITQPTTFTTYMNTPFTLAQPAIQGLVGDWVQSTDPQCTSAKPSFPVKSTSIPIAGNYTLCLKGDSTTLLYPNIKLSVQSALTYQFPPFYTSSNNLDGRILGLQTNDTAYLVDGRLECTTAKQYSPVTALSTSSPLSFEIALARALPQLKICVKTADGTILSSPITIPRLDTFSFPKLLFSSTNFPFTTNEIVEMGSYKFGWYNSTSTCSVSRASAIEIVDTGNGKQYRTSTPSSIRNTVHPCIIGNNPATGAVETYTFTNPQTVLQEDWNIDAESLIDNSKVLMTFPATPYTYYFGSNSCTQKVSDYFSYVLEFNVPVTLKTAQYPEYVHLCVLSESSLDLSLVSDVKRFKYYGTYPTFDSARNTETTFPMGDFPTIPGASYFLSSGLNCNEISSSVATTGGIWGNTTMTVTDKNYSGRLCMGISSQALPQRGFSYLLGTSYYSGESYSNTITISTRVASTIAIPLAMAGPPAYYNFFATSPASSCLAVNPNIASNVVGDMLIVNITGGSLTSFFKCHVVGPTTYYTIEVKVDSPVASIPYLGVQQFTNAVFDWTDFPYGWMGFSSNKDYCDSQNYVQAGVGFISISLPPGRYYICAPYDLTIPSYLTPLTNSFMDVAPTPASQLMYAIKGAKMNIPVYSNIAANATSDFQYTIACNMPNGNYQTINTGYLNSTVTNTNPLGISYLCSGGVYKFVTLHTVSDLIVPSAVYIAPQSFINITHTFTASDGGFDYMGFAKDSGCKKQVGDMIPASTSTMYVTEEMNALAEANSLFLCNYNATAPNTTPYAVGVNTGATIVAWEMPKFLVPFQVSTSPRRIVISGKNIGVYKYFFSSTTAPFMQYTTPVFNGVDGSPGYIDINSVIPEGEYYPCIQTQSGMVPNQGSFICSRGTVMRFEGATIPFGTLNVFTDTYATVVTNKMPVNSRLIVSAAACTYATCLGQTATFSANVTSARTAISLKGATPGNDYYTSLIMPGDTDKSYTLYNLGTIRIHATNVTNGTTTQQIWKQRAYSFPLPPMTAATPVTVGFTDDPFCNVATGNRQNVTSGGTVTYTPANFGFNSITKLYLCYSIGYTPPGTVLHNANITLLAFPATTLPGGDFVRNSIVYYRCTDCPGSLSHMMYLSNTLTCGSQAYSLGATSGATAFYLQNSINELPYTLCIAPSGSPGGSDFTVGKSVNIVTSRNTVSNVDFYPDMEQDFTFTAATFNTTAWITITDDVPSTTVDVCVQSDYPTKTFPVVNGTFTYDGYLNGQDIPSSTHAYICYGAFPGSGSGYAVNLNLALTIKKVGYLIGNNYLFGARVLKSSFVSQTSSYLITQWVIDIGLNCTFPEKLQMNDMTDSVNVNGFDTGVVHVDAERLGTNQYFACIMIGSTTYKSTKHALQFHIPPTGERVVPVNAVGILDLSISAPFYLIEPFLVNNVPRCPTKKQAFLSSTLFTTGSNGSKLIRVSSSVAKTATYCLGFLTDPDEAVATLLENFTIKYIDHNFLGAPQPNGVMATYNFTDFSSARGMAFYTESIENCRTSVTNPQSMATGIFNIDGSIAPLTSPTRYLCFNYTELGYSVHFTHHPIQLFTIPLPATGNFILGGTYFFSGVLPANLRYTFKNVPETSIFSTPWSDGVLNYTSAFVPHDMTPGPYRVGVENKMGGIYYFPVPTILDPTIIPKKTFIADEHIKTLTVDMKTIPFQAVYFSQDDCLTQDIFTGVSRYGGGLTAFTLGTSQLRAGVYQICYRTTGGVNPGDSGMMKLPITVLRMVNSPSISLATQGGAMQYSPVRLQATNIANNTMIKFIPTTATCSATNSMNTVKLTGTFSYSTLWADTALNLGITSTICRNGQTLATPFAIVPKLNLSTGAVVNNQNNILVGDIPDPLLVYSLYKADTNVKIIGGITPSGGVTNFQFNHVGQGRYALTAQYFASRRRLAAENDVLGDFSFMKVMDIYFQSVPSHSIVPLTTTFTAKVDVNPGSYLFFSATNACSPVAGLPIKLVPANQIITQVFNAFPAGMDNTSVMILCSTISPTGSNNNVPLENIQIQLVESFAGPRTWVRVVGSGADMKVFEISNAPATLLNANIGLIPNGSTDCFSPAAEGVMSEGVATFNYHNLPAGTYNMCMYEKVKLNANTNRFSVLISNIEIEMIVLDPIPDYYLLPSTPDYDMVIPIHTSFDNSVIFFLEDGDTECDMANMVQSLGTKYVSGGVAAFKYYYHFAYAGRRFNICLQHFEEGLYFLLEKQWVVIDTPLPSLIYGHLPGTVFMKPLLREETGLGASRFMYFTADATTCGSAATGTLFASSGRISVTFDSSYTNQNFYLCVGVGDQPSIKDYHASMVVIKAVAPITAATHLFAGIDRPFALTGTFDADEMIYFGYNDCLVRLMDFDMTTQSITRFRATVPNNLTHINICATHTSQGFNSNNVIKWRDSPIFIYVPTATFFYIPNGDQDIKLMDTFTPPYVFFSPSSTDCDTMPFLASRDALTNTISLTNSQVTTQLNSQAVWYFCVSHVSTPGSFSIAPKTKLVSIAERNYDTFAFFDNGLNLTFPEEEAGLQVFMAFDRECVDRDSDLYTIPTGASPIVTFTFQRNFSGNRYLCYDGGAARPYNMPVFFCRVINTISIPYRTWYSESPGTVAIRGYSTLYVNFGDQDCLNNLFVNHQLPVNGFLNFTMPAVPTDTPLVYQACVFMTNTGFVPVYKIPQGLIVTKRPTGSFAIGDNDSASVSIAISDNMLTYWVPEASTTCGTPEPSISSDLVKNQKALVTTTNGVNGRYKMCVTLPTETGGNTYTLDPSVDDQLLDGVTLTVTPAKFPRSATIYEGTSIALVYDEYYYNVDLYFSPDDCLSAPDGTFIVDGSYERAFWGNAGSYTLCRLPPGGQIGVDHQNTGVVMTILPNQDFRTGTITAISNSIVTFDMYEVFKDLYYKMKKPVDGCPPGETYEKFLPRNNTDPKESSVTLITEYRTEAFMCLSPTPVSDRYTVFTHTSLWTFYPVTPIHLTTYVGGTVTIDSSFVNNTGRVIFTKYSCREEQYNGGTVIFPQSTYTVPNTLPTDGPLYLCYFPPGVLVLGGSIMMDRTLSVKALPVKTTTIHSGGSTTVNVTSIMHATDEYFWVAKNAGSSCATIEPLLGAQTTIPANGVISITTVGVAPGDFAMCIVSSGTTFYAPGMLLTVSDTSIYTGDLFGYVKSIINKKLPTLPVGSFVYFVKTSDGACGTPASFSSPAEITVSTEYTVDASTTTGADIGLYTGCLGSSITPSVTDAFLVNLKLEILAAPLTTESVFNNAKKAYRVPVNYDMTYHLIASSFNDCKPATITTNSRKTGTIPLATNTTIIDYGTITAPYNNNVQYMMCLVDANGYVAIRNNFITVSSTALTSMEVFGFIGVTLVNNAPGSTANTFYHYWVPSTKTQCNIADAVAPIAQGGANQNINTGTTVSPLVAAGTYIACVSTNPAGDAFSDSLFTGRSLIVYEYPTIVTHNVFTNFRQVISYAGVPTSLYVGYSASDNCGALTASDKQSLQFGSNLAFTITTASSSSLCLYRSSAGGSQSYLFTSIKLIATDLYTNTDNIVAYNEGSITVDFSSIPGYYVYVDNLGSGFSCGSPITTPASTSAPVSFYFNNTVSKLYFFCFATTATASGDDIKLTSRYVHLKPKGTLYIGDLFSGGTTTVTHEIAIANAYVYYVLPDATTKNCMAPLATGFGLVNFYLIAPGNYEQKVDGTFVGSVHPCFGRVAAQNAEDTYYNETFQFVAPSIVEFIPSLYINSTITLDVTTVYPHPFYFSWTDDIDYCGGAIPTTLVNDTTVTVNATNNYMSFITPVTFYPCMGFSWDYRMGVTVFDSQPLTVYGPLSHNLTYGFGNSTSAITITGITLPVTDSWYITGPNKTDCSTDSGLVAFKNINAENTAVDISFVDTIQSGTYHLCAGPGSVPSAHNSFINRMPIDVHAMIVTNDNIASVNDRANVLLPGLPSGFKFYYGVKKGDCSVNNSPITTISSGATDFSFNYTGSAAKSLPLCIGKGNVAGAGYLALPYYLDIVDGATTPLETLAFPGQPYKVTMKTPKRNISLSALPPVDTSSGDQGTPNNLGVPEDTIGTIYAWYVKSFENNCINIETDLLPQPVAVVDGDTVFNTNDFKGAPNTSYTLCYQLDNDVPTPLGLFLSKSIIKSRSAVPSLSTVAYINGTFTADYSFVDPTDYYYFTASNTDCATMANAGVISNTPTPTFNYTGTAFTGFLCIGQTNAVSTASYYLPTVNQTLLPPITFTPFSTFEKGIISFSIADAAVGHLVYFSNDNCATNQTQTFEVTTTPQMMTLNATGVVTGAYALCISSSGTVSRFNTTVYHSGDLTILSSPSTIKLSGYKHFPVPITIDFTSYNLPFSYYGYWVAEGTTCDVMTPVTFPFSTPLITTLAAMDIGSYELCVNPANSAIGSTRLTSITMEVKAEPAGKEYLMTANGAAYLELSPEIEPTDYLYWTSGVDCSSNTLGIAPSLPNVSGAIRYYTFYQMISSSLLDGEYKLCISTDTTLRITNVMFPNTKIHVINNIVTDTFNYAALSSSITTSTIATITNSLAPMTTYWVPDTAMDCSGTQYFKGQIAVGDSEMSLDHTLNSPATGRYLLCISINTPGYYDTIIMRFNYLLAFEPFPSMSLQGYRDHSVIFQFPAVAPNSFYAFLTETTCATPTSTIEVIGANSIVEISTPIAMSLATHHLCLTPFPANEEPGSALELTNVQVTVHPVLKKSYMSAYQGSIFTLPSDFGLYDNYFYMSYSTTPCASAHTAYYQISATDPILFDTTNAVTNNYRVCVSDTQTPKVYNTTRINVSFTVFTEVTYSSAPFLNQGTTTIDIIGVLGAHYIYFAPPGATDCSIVAPTLSTAYYSGMALPPSHSFAGVDPGIYPLCVSMSNAIGAEYASFYASKVLHVIPEPQYKVSGNRGGETLLPKILPEGEVFYYHVLSTDPCGTVNADYPAVYMKDQTGDFAFTLNEEGNYKLCIGLGVGAGPHDITVAGSVIEVHSAIAAYTHVAYGNSTSIVANMNYVGNYYYWVKESAVRCNDISVGVVGEDAYPGFTSASIAYDETLPVGTYVLCTSYTNGRNQYGDVMLKDNKLVIPAWIEPQTISSFVNTRVVFNAIGMNPAHYYYWVEATEGKCGVTTTPLSNTLPALLTRYGSTNMVQMNMTATELGDFVLCISVDGTRSEIDSHFANVKLTNAAPKTPTITEGKTGDQINVQIPDLSVGDKVYFVKDTDQICGTPAANIPEKEVTTNGTFEAQYQLENVLPGEYWMCLGKTGVDVSPSDILTPDVILKVNESESVWWWIVLIVILFLLVLACIYFRKVLLPFLASCCAWMGCGKRKKQKKEENEFVDVKQMARPAEVKQNEDKEEKEDRDNDDLLVGDVSFDGVEGANLGKSLQASQGLDLSMKLDFDAGIDKLFESNQSFN